MEEGKTAGRTTLRQRFGGLATAHACYSLLGAFLFPALFVMQMGEADLSRFSIALQGILSMAIYFFLGVLAAGWGEWSVPTTREKVWMIVLPCAVLMVWEALILAILCLPMGASVFSWILALVLFGMVSPSCWFYICCGFLCESVFTSALLAAVLPPLLFGLGSFWQAKRQAAKKEEP